MRGSNDLKKIITRWKNLSQFFDLLMFQLCQKMVAVLQRNTPGTVFPTQWVFAISHKNRMVVGEVYNTRLGSEEHAGSDEAFERIAFYLNDGTDPHMILPVKAQALHWEEDGQHFFSKGHIVSGITASHFKEQAERVIEEFEPSIQGKFEAYMNDGRLPG